MGRTILSFHFMNSVFVPRWGTLKIPIKMEVKKDEA